MHLKLLRKKFFKKLIFIDFSIFAVVVGVGDLKFVDEVVRNDIQWSIDNGEDSQRLLMIKTMGWS